MENVRSYNSSMSFASLGAQIEAPHGYGPYCFRIHGQIYHRAGTLHPHSGEERKYAQLYILDPEEATRQRMNLLENAKCQHSIMQKLTPSGEFLRESLGESCTLSPLVSVPSVL